MCVCVCDACGTILLLLFLTWQRGGQRTAFHHHNNHSRPVPIRHAWHFSFFMCPVQQSLNPSIPLPFPFPFHSHSHLPYNQTQSLRGMRNAAHAQHTLQLLRVSFSGIYDTYTDVRTYVCMYIPYTIYDILCRIYVIKCSYLIYLRDNLIDIKLIPRN